MTPTDWNFFMVLLLFDGHINLSNCIKCLSSTSIQKCGKENEVTPQVWNKIKKKERSRNSIVCRSSGSSRNKLKSFLFPTVAWVRLRPLHSKIESYSSWLIFSSFTMDLRRPILICGDSTFNHSLFVHPMLGISFSDRVYIERVWTLWCGYSSLFYSVLLFI